MSITINLPASPRQKPQPITDEDRRTWLAQHLRHELRRDGFRLPEMSDAEILQRADGAMFLDRLKFRLACLELRLAVRQEFVPILDWLSRLVPRGLR